MTAVLAERGERVHPASRCWPSESAHIESEAGEHDLHVFQAFRRMDEILVANFMVFHDLVADEHYDLVVADEGWDIDYFLHENPELKRSAVRLAHRLRRLAADARRRRGRGRADRRLQRRDDRADRPLPAAARPVDLRRQPRRPGRPTRSGPGLPTVRDWTTRALRRSRATSPASPPCADREELRAELGYRPDERVCLVAVGGSGVGGTCCAGSSTAFPEAEEQVPGLRMVVVARAADRPGLGARAGRRGGPRLRARSAPRSWPPATSPWCRAG